MTKHTPSAHPELVEGPAPAASREAAAEALLSRARDYLARVFHGETGRTLQADIDAFLKDSQS